MRFSAFCVFALSGTVAAAFSASARADTYACQTAQCTTAVTIHLQKTDIPASDLVYTSGGNTEILTPDQAWDLEKNSGVDLSTLDPDASSAIWTGLPSDKNDSVVDQRLPIQSADTTAFQSIIEIANGRFKMNVQTQPASGAPQTITLLFAKDLHTYLIKKEIMRKLGYQIPAMKYLPRVSVRFTDINTENLILSTMASDLQSQITRWQLPAAAGGDPLTVSFQDIIALDPTSVFPNVTFSPPTVGGSATTPETARILRSLSLIYGLTGIGESLNATDWSAGTILNGSFTMSLPMAANFSCSLDDALWMVRKIGVLTRKDFTDAVAKAYYPDGIAQLVVEKLIARRNSIIDDFQSVLGANIPDLPANITYSDAPAIVSGKVVQQTYPGYASRFAYNPWPTALRDIWYYPLSLIESNTIENVISLANSKIPSLSTSSDITQHSNSLLSKAIAQYETSGTAMKVPFGAWIGPLASGGLSLSRDVVIGNYMGTTNLISLADTFGFSASVGFMVGFDAVPVNVAMSAVAQGTLSINFTHLTPLDQNLDGLKDALSVPIKNMLVSWLFRRSSLVFQNISAAQNQKGITTDQLKAALQNDMNELTSYLGPGESLILTETAEGNENMNVSLTAPVPISPSATITGGANQIIISRIRIYRPENQQVINVYVDGGKLAGLSLSFGASLGAEFSFPVLAFGSQVTTGNIKSNIYSVNINPDPTANPGIYASSLALSSLFESGSSSILKSQQTPSTVSTNFTDKSSSFQFLFFQGRTLKQNGQIHVTLPAGFPLPNGQPLPKNIAEDFLSLSDGAQSGNNFQEFLTNVGSNILQRLTGSGNTSIDTQASVDPGQTLFGESTTRNVTLQAALAPALTQPMVQVQHSWEGWQLSAAGAQAINDGLTKQYGFKVFPDGFLLDAQVINLYDLTFTINFYEPAILSIMNADPTAIATMVNNYNVQWNCEGAIQRGADNQRNSIMCTAVRNFYAGYTNYRQGSTTLSPKDKAKDYLQVISGLEQFLDFGSIKQLLSDPQNQIYISATLNGIRKSSENISTPINSNTYGHNSGPGVIDELDSILSIDDGEMNAQWIRDWL